jgi:uncharacterized protein
MADLPRCRPATWEDVDRWADRLADQVRDAEHLPQTIVGLTRGGWVPSRLIADRLRVKRLVSLRAQHWGTTATPSGAAELTEGLSGAVQDEEVLVIDDITDTGESLDLATKHVAEAGAKRVESGVFLHISHSKFLPTYFGEEIPRESWAWIVFPWNYWEDLATLVQRAEPETASLEEIHRLLKAKCNWDVPFQDLEWVVSDGRTDSV